MQIQSEFVMRVVWIATGLAKDATEWQRYLLRVLVRAPEDGLSGGENYRAPGT